MIESYEGEVVVAEMVYRDWENRASSRFLFRLTALGCAVDEELCSLDKCNNPKVCQIHLIYASMSLILPKSTIDPCAIVILWFPRCIICRWYRLPKIPNNTIRKLRNPQIKLRYKWLRKRSWARHPSAMGWKTSHTLSLAMPWKASRSCSGDVWSSVMSTKRLMNASKDTAP